MTSEQQVLADAWFEEGMTTSEIAMILTVADLSLQEPEFVKGKFMIYLENVATEARRKHFTQVPR